MPQGKPFDKKRIKKANPMMSTTPEERRAKFAELFCRLGNATEAARELGYKDPHNAGWHFMKRKDVQEMIAELQPKVDAQIQKKSQEDINSLAWKIASIARTNITDIVNLVKKERTYKRKVDKKEVEITEVYYELEFKPFSELTEEQKYAIKGVEMTKNGPKITMYDKTWSLDMIARSLGYVRDTNRDEEKVRKGAVLIIPDNGRSKGLADFQTPQDIEFLEEIIEETNEKNKENE